MTKSEQFKEWMLLQMADSALPVGGFVASYGLEAALQLGGLDFDQFLIDSIEVNCYSSLPIIAETMNCMSIDCMDNNEDSRLDKLIKIDREYDAFIGTNHVNSRASVMQGLAYLTLISKSFSNSKGTPLVDDFKFQVRKKEAFGHFAVAFAMACHCLEINLQQAEFLYLFMHVRTIVSSAIRLGIFGPYVGQTIIFESKTLVEKTLEQYRLHNEESIEPVLTSPLLEIIQSSHDKLYTRIFNS